MKQGSGYEPELLDRLADHVHLRGDYTKLLCYNQMYDRSDAELFDFISNHRNRFIFAAHNFFKRSSCYGALVTAMTVPAGKFITPAGYATPLCKAVIQTPRRAQPAVYHRTSRRTNRRTNPLLHFDSRLAGDTVLPMIEQLYPSATLTE